MKQKRVPNIATLEYDPDYNILIVTYDPIVIDKDVIERLIEEGVQFAEKERFAILIDFSKSLYMTKEARQIAVEKEKERVIAQALIIDNPLLRELYNIFQSFGSSPFPIKAFKNKDKALEWLRNYMKDKGLGGSEM